MKKHFQDLLKGIFLGSISSLVASHGAEASVYDLTKLKVNDNGQTEVKVKKDYSRKFILKFQSDDSYLIAGHSSHASHASHASHRSSSTYSGSSYSTSSSSYNSPALKPISPSKITSPTYNTSIITANTAKIISLGDRVLEKGMIGNDVSQLKKILIEKKILEASSIEESTLFDVKIEKAVIVFQKSLGLVADGMVGSKTIYYLKK